jgi:hypothetical protein
LAGGAAGQPAGSARAHARFGRLSVRSLAWWPRRSGCQLCCRHRVRVRVWHPVSSVRCERPVSTGPVQVTGVRCGRLSVQVSTIRPPASGVRCPRVAASAVSNGNEVAGVAWAGSRMAGMARGRRGRPPCPRRRVVCSRLEPGLEADAGRAGPADDRLGLGRRGRWLAVGPGRPGGRPR